MFTSEFTKSWFKSKSKPKEQTKQDISNPFQNVLIHYIRPYYDAGDSTPIGCVVALKDYNGVIQYGWSLCRPNEKYDKEYGRSEAIAKALVASDIRVKDKENRPALRHSYIKELNKVKKVDVVSMAIDRLEERVKKYFK